MQDLSAFLASITALRGISGDEGPVAAAIADAFRPLCDEVEIDAMGSVIARIGSKGPRVLITAHEDEIGLMATDVEEDGAVRFTRVGGVDPRILPGSRVTVHTEAGPMTGVVGALPPHLLSAEDREKNYKLEKLHVDLALPVERVRELVHPGTPITLCGPLKKYENNRYAGKTVDDRGCVAIMLRVAELLQKRELDAQVYFVAAVQEEVGGLGIQTSAYRIDPDIGIAIDVTHGEMPNCHPDSVHPLEKVVLTQGPNIHPGLFRHLMDLAAKIHVDAECGVCGGATSTDADGLQLARAGVPTALVELPLKYMHTTVEMYAETAMEESARLLAAFVTGLDSRWEEILCY